MNTVVFIPVLVPIDRLMSIRIWIALLYEADTEAPKIMHTDPLPSPHDAACFRYESTTVKAIQVGGGFTLHDTGTPRAYLSYTERHRYISW